MSEKKPSKELFPSPWTHLAALLPPSKDQINAAARLIDLYTTEGAWKKTLPELLNLDLTTVSLFYAHLERSSEKPIQEKNSDAPWMESYSFINIRALGRHGSFGTFLDAAKIIPSLRVRSLHLGPFTVYDHHVIYAVSSVRSISSLVTDLELEKRGFTREWQLAAFVQGCRLLGKAAGFDLEPHLTQFAIPVLEKPEAFRWIKLNDAKTAPAFPQNEILTDRVQRSIADEVRTIVRQQLDTSGEPTLEYATEDERRRREPIYHALIGTLINHGLWTIPSQIWAGDGVPQFNYMHGDGYPVFFCRDRKGADRQKEALNIITPVRCDTASDFLADIFPYWRDRFGFDFIRFDSVDHIFDSCSDFNTPRSDRPAPVHLKKILARAKENIPGTGALAERMGSEFPEYSECGFDTLLGDDMFWNVNSALVEKSLQLSEDISAFNTDGETPVTVCFAVDTHDTGDPNLLGTPLVESLSSEELLQRHFLSRFASCGKGFRPKYEVVGASDRSYGLFHSNITDDNLVFRGDTGHCTRYHFLEDIYDRLSGIIKDGSFAGSSIDKDGARWTISSKKGTILCALAFAGGQGIRIDDNCEWTAFPFRALKANGAPGELPAGECCVSFVL